MWVYRNRPTWFTHPIVLYDWQSFRRADSPRAFLNDFSGAVVTDGYQNYCRTAGPECCRLPDSFQYLELLLTELPKHAEDKNLSFLDDLMPWSPRVQKECPSKFKKS